MPVHSKRHGYVADQLTHAIDQREVPPAGDVHRRDQSAVLVQRPGRADPDRRGCGVTANLVDQLGQRGEHLVSVAGWGTYPSLSENPAVGGYDSGGHLRAADINAQYRRCSVAHTSPVSAGAG